MNGLMMDFPLTLSAVLRRVETFFGHKQIVTRLPDRSLRRSTYGDMGRRARQLAWALRALGVQPGDRVATLAWNHHQHLEAYFGIPEAGAVLHTLNLRLHPDELAYIVNHAEDKVILVDRSLLPLLGKFRGQLKAAPIIVVFGDGPMPELPEGANHGGAVLDYEALLAGQEPRSMASAGAPGAPRLMGLAGPDPQENQAAALCYTTGTTGKPKGVLYSHRALVLHSMALCMADVFGLFEGDIILPAVPMFHANAWGLPYAAAMVGASLVFPGPCLDPPSLLDLYQGERVTFTGGVPTIWLGILQLLDKNSGAYDLSALRAMVVGGSAAPVSMIRGFAERHGIRVIHAWGMTELSPLGTVSRLPSDLNGAPPEQRFAYQARQGRPSPFVEIRARGEGGLCPWDDKSLGELEVRGPWVAARYFSGPETPQKESESETEGGPFTPDGWFRTGDVVTIDWRGYVQIQDRSKDLIKSGGEWISSVGLENALMGHPAVAEAAVVPIPHPRWQERPLAVVVLKEGHTQSAELLASLRAHLAAEFAAFWIPDDFEFVTEIPRTSAGKFLKSALRQRYKDRTATG